jgi:hypothetical protein
MGIGLETRRPSLIAILLVLLVSLFLLSVLSNILTGYPERSQQHEPEKDQTGTDTNEQPAVLLFKVSPAIPQLYCRVSTADYYTGLDWLRTTVDKVVEEFPQVQDANASRVFTVEINTSQRETLLPLPSSDSSSANLSLTQIKASEFYMDAIGNIYKVKRHEQAEELQLVYNVTWLDIEVDDKLISLDVIPEEILDKYLQLPDISAEVWKLAKDLEDPSYSLLDQILADVQYLRTNFIYDVEARAQADERMHIPQGSNVFSYIQRRKGICIDAATALAIILRIQEIPTRISIGYKPGRTEGGKLLYYTTGGHAVTEVYLPPYGWIQFDATPPLEEKPLVNVWPFKKVCSPGSRLFYQLSITNRRDSADNFKLFVDSRQKWNVVAAPEELSIEAFQTADALLEVIIPEDADLGEKDVVTITVASLASPEIAFSILAIIQAENIFQISTTTTLGNIDESVIRGYTLRVNGTVLAANDEKVDNMTVFIFLTKSKENEGVIVGKGYSKQGNFQIESVIPYLMEIGDYKVIPISLGTTQYAPSSSASITRVRATTRIELASGDQFLLGYGAIHGNLLWDNGTGLAKAPISLKITSLATPSEVRELQNLTSKDGSFRIKTTFEDAGIYEAKAMFPGNEYVLGSNATCLVELKRGVPSIQIFGESIAVRGEVFNITVTIQYKDIRVWGEPATVAFDNQLLATIETRDNGSCTWSFLVDSEETLGPHFFTVALKKGTVSAVYEVAVKSKTRLATKVSNIAGGMFLLFSASISDDHDLPIQRAEIVVDNYGLSWKTDSNGNLTFLLDNIELWPANLSLAARFEGSELYLPVMTEKEVILEPVISLPFLIPLVSPTLAAMVFVCAKHLVRRGQTLRQTSDVEVVGESAMVEEEPIYKPQKMQPLKIVLPDIGSQFPNVWGIRAKLRAEIVLDKSALEKTHKRDVKVLIDEETVASVRLSQQGRAELSHVFIKKGEQKMRAILPRISRRRPWNAEINLRIVDYGEEIIRLYNEFTEKLTGHGVHAEKEMTTREIESLILGIGDFDPEALRKVTICFEKAEYSNHLATRKDYEVMHLSLKELNIDVE